MRSRVLVAMLVAALAIPAAAGSAPADGGQPGPALAAKKKPCKKGKGKASAAKKKCKKKKKGGKDKPLPPPPKISLDPTSHTFPLSGSSRVFTVTNAPGTDAAGPFQVTLDGLNKDRFSISENGCNIGTVLQGGQSCTFRITYASAGGGPHGATVIVEAGVGGGATAELTGIGI